MADRRPSFPMLQSFNNGAGIMSHQQTPFQHQQAQQADGQQVNGLGPNPDSRQMWQQMQQQQPQLQQQQQQHFQEAQHLQHFRPPQNGDGLGNQVNPQMAEFMRNAANLPHLQAQQQQQAAQQQQQPFGLASSQLNSGMHDLQQSQHMQNTLQAGGMGNLAFGGGNQAALQAAFQQRSMMLQNGNPEVSRQLELLSASQLQQSQNGMVGNLARLAAAQQHQRQQAGLNAMAQGQNNQHALFALQGGDGSGAGVMGGPSGHGGMPQTMQGAANGQGGGGPQFPSLDELRGHASRIKASIMSMDTEIMALVNTAGVKSEADQQRTNDLRTERTRRAAVLKKVLHAVTEMTRAGVNNLTMSNVQQPGGANLFSTSPHPPPMGARNPQSSPAWNPQMPPPQSQPFGNHLPGGMSHLGQAGQSALRPNSAQLHDQAGNQTQIPQQRAPGMQTPSAQMQGHMSPPPGNTAVPQGLGQGRPPPHIEQQQRGTPFQQHQQALHAAQQSVQPPPEGMRIPPLAREKFQNAFQNFCRAKRIQTDERLLQIGDHRIDLYQLHVEVRNAGGLDSVTQKDLWAVIGGKMGFVQFPGTAMEPAKCGPAIAQNLSHVFREYLTEFDAVYVQTFMNHNAQGRAQLTGIPQGGPLAMPGAPPAMPNANVPRLGSLDPKQLNIMVQFASTPSEVLRNSNLPEKLIHMVESNRPFLQQMARSQPAFREAIQAKAREAGQLQQQAQAMQAANGASAMSTQFMGGQQQQQQQQQHPGGLPPGVMRPGTAQSPPLGAPAGMGTGLDAPFIQNLPGGARQATPAVPGPSMHPQQRLFNAQTLQQAQIFVQNVKQSIYQTTDFQKMGSQHIAEEQRLEFHQSLEQLHRLAVDLESNLPMYAAIQPQNDTIKKMCMIVLTTTEQRRMLSSGNPRYIIELKLLHQLIQQAQLFVDRMRATLIALKNGQAPPQPPQPPQPALVAPVPPIPRPTPSPHPAQSIIPPGAMGRHLPLQQPPAPRRKNAMVPGSAPSPTPTASATTPQASAATPTPSASAASPQTPKSPKAKAAPKPKAAGAVKTRKPSVSSTPVAKPAVPAPAPEAAPAPAPVTAPARTQQPTPTGVKRQREEETVPALETPVDAPSPNKRAKTEWEGPPSEEVVKRQEEVNAVKTDEDATVFLERMQELMKMAESQDASVTSGIEDSLAEILRGFSGPDYAEASTSLLDGPGGRGASPPPGSVTPGDDLLEFFDFSSFAGADDDAAAASTPDLVPSSSSTNPSPESGSEAEHGALGDTPKLAAAPKAGDTKAAPAAPAADDGSDDFLRLGAWGEIDGGESSYWQPNDGWKWSGKMPTADWAMLQS